MRVVLQSNIAAPQASAWLTTWLGADAGEPLFFSVSIALAAPKRRSTRLDSKRQSILTTSSNYAMYFYLPLPLPLPIPMLSVTLGASSCLSEKVDIVEVALTLRTLLTLPQSIQLTVETLARSNDLPPGLHSGAKSIED